MLLIKICRECKKVIITRNDETYKDEKIYNNYLESKLLCECDKN